MKYASIFIFFQVLILILYIWSLFFYENSSSQNKTSTPVTVNAFNYFIKSKNGDEVFFTGSIMEKQDENIKFLNPRGRFKGDGTTILFSSDEGGLDRDKNIYLKGAVEIKEKDMIYKSAALTYDNAKKNIFSDSPVTIVMKDGYFTGANFIYDMNEHTAKITNSKGRLWLKNQ